MLGWIVWQEKEKGRVRLVQSAVGGVNFWKLAGPVPRCFWDRQRWRRGLRRLSRCGVHHAAVQGPVPQELLRQFGLQPIEPAPLRLALLPQLLAYTQREWDVPLQRAAVMLRSRRMDAAAVRAAYVLAQNARYLHLDLPAGASSLAGALRCRYGLVSGGAEPPVLEVCISCASVGGVPALHLGEGCAERQQIELEDVALPEANEQLLAAIFQTGKLKVEGIRIKSVEFCA